jgi:predicted lipid carrier protein YhbT
MTLPSAVRDVLTSAELDLGADLRLGPWDVRVLVENVTQRIQEASSWASDEDSSR